MEYKIEKSIPMPESFKNGKVKSAFRMALEAMEVGDSVLIGNDDPRSKRLGPYLAGMKQTLKKSFGYRKESDGFRVWRVQ